ncbi:unnamed protein product, partial [Prorocentrum cordatum]
AAPTSAPAPGAASSFPSWFPWLPEWLGLFLLAVAAGALVAALRGTPLWTWPPQADGEASPSRRKSRQKPAAEKRWRGSPRSLEANDRSAAAFQADLAPLIDKDGTDDRMDERLDSMLLATMPARTPLEASRVPSWVLASQAPPAQQPQAWLAGQAAHPDVPANDAASPHDYQVTPMRMRTPSPYGAARAHMKPPV